MADLIDYVTWRADVTFDYSPFNKIDALIFSQISYLNLKGFVPEDFDDEITLEDFASFVDVRAQKKLKKTLGPLINPETFDLLMAASKSERFGKLKLCGFRDIFSKKNCEQFCAFTVKGKGWNCICFRGTDETIIGWKEDFYLGCMDQIPAQKDALDYFTDALDSLKGKFYVAGHSKGGNEAMYVAINATLKQKKKISKVFNFDGPGFVKETMESENYKNISDKILSVYPECSIVGMIFHHPSNFDIVESSEFIVMQHDAFSWNIMGNDFVKKDKFKDESIFFHATFNQFYAAMSRQEMKNITDKLFDLFLNTGCRTLDDIDDDKLQVSAKVLYELYQLDSRDRKEIKKMAGMFLKAGKGNFPLFNSFKPSISRNSGIIKSLKKD